MKLLVAAADHADDGFSWTVEGELVHLDAGCDPDLGENHDPDCDCLRVFIGLASGKGTTAARVIDVDTTLTELVDAVLAAWIGDGYEMTTAEALDVAEVLMDHAANWPVGAILHRYGDDLEPAQ